MNLHDEIEKLARAGVPQYLICQQLRCGRGPVQVLRRKLGLTGKQPGIAVPPLDTKKVRKMLRRGVSRRVIAVKLGVRESSVRHYAEKNGFNRREPIPPDVREKMVHEIVHHLNYAWDIAAKYKVSYKSTRALVKEVLGEHNLIPGATAIPLQSRYPQKLSEKLRSKG